MPHLVEMQKKHGRENFVAITLCVDDFSAKDREEIKTEAAKILTSKKITVTNLLLDESDKLKEEKLQGAPYPSVYLFNRQGKWKYFSDEENLKHENLEKWVEKFIKEKK